MVGPMDIIAFFQLKLPDHVHDLVWWKTLFYKSQDSNKNQS